MGNRLSRILATAGLLVSTVVLAFSPASPTQAAVVVASCPTVISHATAKALNPENTVVGINNAKDVQAVTHVEMDWRYNKSNFAWGMHNDDISITTTGTGSITDKWMPDMQAVSAADYAPWNTNPTYAGFNANGTPKTKVPYTYEILATVKAKNVNIVIDAKAIPNAAQVDSLVDYFGRPEFSGIQDQLIWMANSPAGVAPVRTEFPNLDYWLIAEPAANASWDGQYIQSLGVSTVTYIIGKITPQLVDYYHSFDPPIKVNTWTTNSAATDSPTGWQKAIDAGVDYLTTDNPIAARALCAGQLVTTPPTTTPPTLPTSAVPTSVSPTTSESTDPPPIG